VDDLLQQRLRLSAEAADSNEVFEVENGRNSLSSRQRRVTAPAAEYQPHTVQNPLGTLPAPEAPPRPAPRPHVQQGQPAPPLYGLLEEVQRPSGRPDLVVLGEHLV
jgi:hypothetical protein